MSTPSKPNILITNDDGIFSPGLKCLWEALEDKFKVSIVAPASDQSGVGVGITLRTPLVIDAVDWEKGTPAWKVSGTPADCIKLGLGVLLKEKPDLIVSGINRGSNAGRTVLYSGTIGGVIEGSLRQIPGIAFSFQNVSNPNYTLAKEYVYSIVDHFLKEPLPLGTILNVNFPDCSQPIKGVRMARQGKSYWIDHPHERLHPEGTPYFWLGGKWDDRDESHDSDVSLMKKGFITVVPIHIDELTDHSLLGERKEKFDNLFNSNF